MWPQVTNAQHPDALSALAPVTQLYLSIDAATEEDLKRLGKLHYLNPRKGGALGLEFKV